jgi:hypothetical protein
MNRLIGARTPRVPRVVWFASVLLACVIGCLPTFPSGATGDGGGGSMVDGTTGENPDGGPPGVNPLDGEVDDTGAPIEAGIPMGVGATCRSGADCTLGFCVDGICCNEACTGSCSACNLPMLGGMCSPVPAGQSPASGHTACPTTAASTCQQDGKCDGKGGCELWANATSCGDGTCDPTSNTAVVGSSCDGLSGCQPAPSVTCAPFKCNPGQTACATACAADTDCVNAPCVNGSCGVVVNGSPCTTGTQCASGNCIDGYCCGTCTGACQACDVAGHQGTCETVSSGQPHGSRPACNGTASCQGACDGTNTVCEYSSSTTCTSQSCTGGTVSLASTCNGSGVCGAQAKSSCNGFACNGAACLTSCSGDGQCAAATPYCGAGKCQATAPLGHACSGSTTCANGTFCVGGVCCGTATCNAPDACHTAGTCTAGTGACSFPLVADSTTCGTNMTCSTGVCGCSVGFSACPSGCVSLQTDAKNCGTCSKACTSVQQCSGGTCQSIQEVLNVNFHSLGGQSATIASSPIGISCSGTTCSASANYPLGSSITLTVTQAGGALIAWSNGCVGTTCNVPINGATTVNVTTTTKNIVFVSSAQHSGNFGSVAAAAPFCNTLAKAAGIPGNFVAFLGTSTTTVFATLGSARGWIRPDGLPVTDTVAGFQKYQMWYPPALNELGAVYTPYFFQGTNPAATCGDWTLTTGTSNGGESPTDEGSRFFGIEGVPCSSAPVMCFGTDFATAVSVTPVAGRHAFVTSGTPTGGLAGADAECQAAASSAGLANPTHFLAMLSTTTASASSRFNLSGANWVRPDGVQIATSTSTLMAGDFLAPIAVDATGTVTNSSYAWTGSAMGPTHVSGSINESCNNWTSAASTVNGSFTDPHYGVPGALTAFPVPTSCDNAFAGIYCLEN